MDYTRMDRARMIRVIPADQPKHVRADAARAELRELTRRKLLLRGGAIAAGVVGGSWLYGTKSVAKALNFALNYQPIDHPYISAAPAGYFHGCFTVNTPVEVERAAAAGINYTICYGWPSLESANPESALGKALARQGMKTFLNVEAPFLHCTAGVGHADLTHIRELVVRFHRSPLLAGYWIKDDDCGDERGAVLAIANLIRSIDKDPSHLIAPGFGDSGSVQRNYVHGQGDLLGFYPYPEYDRGPAYEVPRMLQAVRERTPSGATPPPFIGIYQAFATPPQRPRLSITEIVDQARSYMALGAAGVTAYGWESGSELLAAANDATLRAGIGAVTGWLVNGEGRAHVTPGKLARQP